MNGNKTATATFKNSGSADFAITKITLSPTNPNVGDLFGAMIEVKNTGTVAADGGYIDIWLNQSAAQTCYADGNTWAAVGTIKPGATKTLTIPLRAAKAGTKTLRAFVDSWCETTEPNETNNQLTKEYTVK